MSTAAYMLTDTALTVLQAFSCFSECINMTTTTPCDVYDNLPLLSLMYGFKLSMVMHDDIMNTSWIRIGLLDSFQPYFVVLAAQPTSFAGLLLERWVMSS